MLEPIYETVVEGSRYGYRARRSPHQCLEALRRTIQRGKVNHVVETDISGFFNEVSHDGLIKFLQRRIGAPRIICLIRCVPAMGV